MPFVWSQLLASEATFLSILTLIEIDIQQKKYRPSAFWKRVDAGDAKPQYADPTPTEIPARQEHHESVNDPATGHAKSPVIYDTAKDASPRFVKTEFTLGGQDAELGEPLPTSSGLILSSKCLEGKPEKAICATESLLVPRRFHLTRKVSSSPMIRSTPKHGVQKKRNRRMDDVAMFVEKVNRVSEIKSQAALRRLSGFSRLKESSTASPVVSEQLRKRPIISVAERARKAATQEQANVPGDPTIVSTKASQSIKTPSNQWNYGSEELAEQLHAIALEETRAQDQKLFQLPIGGNQSLKFKPKPPKTRPLDIPLSSSPTVEETAMSSSDDDVGSDEQYVYDTYVRASASFEETVSPRSGISNNPTMGIVGGKVGILVIDINEEALWDSYGVDDSSDPELNSEDDDENGPCRK